MNKAPVAPIEPIVSATAIPLKPDYSVRAENVSRTPTSLTEYQIQQLMKQGFTKGLAMFLNDMKKVFALRIWIVDNSGSMQAPDGQRLVDSSTNTNSIRMVPCSRWEEIVDCVEYHARLAAIIEAPTRFRLLNNPGANVGPQQFSIAEDQNCTLAQQVNQATSIMRRASPSGCTPLTQHIFEIYDEVSQLAPTLRSQGQKVVITIATDGLPSDEFGVSGHIQNREFVDALRMLEGLPVWVVIRLCTDDENVVDYYNELDGQLELSLEVLDDFCGEAAEVTKVNPWLNYALPLHRMREFGFHHRVFDMLDERPLLKSEFRAFLLLLCGQEHMDGMADPSIDWDVFFQDVVRLVARQYNPMTKRVSPWINTARLNTIHGGSSCGCSIM